MLPEHTEKVRDFAVAKASTGSREVWWTQRAWARENRKMPTERESTLIHYRFDLELTKFWKQQVDVFTMTVWICTEVMPSKETAQTAFAWALNTFVEGTRTPPPGYTFTPML